ncbi:DNA-formamidopyrimidine glycosylase [Ligilactobacillus cholophilus]|uniref:DNA-formamidopyrimidine glycosylase n=1 Tax=Ligilactobacillus cholophilus TaxID=3050131 RepID=UPI0025AF2C3B|nr:DNA-formamidopyrimidine glycosylase [Ligilactobacillus cholophilus]
MPELPEVETVRRGVSAQVLNIKIKKVDIYYTKMIVGDIDNFKKNITGQKIEKIDRRGKYLLFRFSNNYTMVSHLRMEGKYLIEDHDVPLEKHSHVVFELDDGRDLRYNDTRKFGRMQLVKTGEELNLPGIKKLGPEPLCDDFTVDDFYQRLQKKKKMIKPALLDQTVVTGLGNIYVDEVLWMSKIHPQTIASHLTKADVKKLHDNIIKELKLAIKAQGTTVFTFKTAFNHAGDFQNQLHVYRRTNELCERCGTKIERIVVGQRGTHICPKEQKIK